MVKYCEFFFKNQYFFRDDACMKDSEQDKICRTQCWPMDWLPRDVPYLRILGINYETNLSMWTPLCPIESSK